MPRGWPATLTTGTDPRITVRPLGYADGPAWGEVRRRNAAWLTPWDATRPPGAVGRPGSFRSMVKRLRAAARQDRNYPFAILVDDEFAGQLTINNVVRGSAQFASIGYWIDQRWAGYGVVPRAVAMVIDHAFTEMGLHRIEICIRPENTNSLRVVEKLGIREVGFAPGFLHIDGEWRDHRIYAVTVEEAPEGLLARYENGRSAGW